MNAALRISERDNVAVALEHIGRGCTIGIEGASIEALDDIPSGHKIAIATIGVGEQVIKYGSPIGLATSAIAAGQHVHTHNLESTRGRGDRGPNG
jgi:altronate dehydratase small subunit